MSYLFVNVKSGELKISIFVNKFCVDFVYNLLGKT